MTQPIRIWIVNYCGNVGRPRVATTIAKVPYGGAYAMTELLTRMISIGQIRWFAIGAAGAKEIAESRDSLQRWLPALIETSRITRVDWTK